MDKEMLNALSSLLDEKLEPIKSEINTIKSEVKTINSRLDSLEKKVDGISEQTADLLEFRNEIITKVDGIREDLSTVELVTANNYKDIAKLKAIKII